MRRQVNPGFSLSVPHRQDAAQLPPLPAHEPVVGEHAAVNPNPVLVPLLRRADPPGARVRRIVAAFGAVYGGALILATFLGWTPTSATPDVAAPFADALLLLPLVLALVAWLGSLAWDARWRRGLQRQRRERGEARGAGRDDAFADPGGAGWTIESTSPAVPAVAAPAGAVHRTRTEPPEPPGARIRRVLQNAGFAAGIVLVLTLLALGITNPRAIRNPQPVYALAFLLPLAAGCALWAIAAILDSIWRRGRRGARRAARAEDPPSPDAR